MTALWTKKASVRNNLHLEGLLFAIQYVKNTSVYKVIARLPSLGLCDASLSYQSCKEAQQVGKRQPSWNHESTQASCAGEEITPGKLLILQMQMDCMNNSCPQSLGTRCPAQLWGSTALLSSGLSQGHLLSVRPFLSAWQESTCGHRVLSIISSAKSQSSSVSHTSTRIMWSERLSQYTAAHLQQNTDSILVFPSKLVVLGIHYGWNCFHKARAERHTTQLSGGIYKQHSCRTSFLISIIMIK